MNNPSYGQQAAASNFLQANQAIPTPPPVLIMERLQTLNGASEHIGKLLIELQEMIRPVLSDPLPQPQTPPLAVVDSCQMEQAITDVGINLSNLQWMIEDIKNRLRL